LLVFFVFLINGTGVFALELEELELELEEFELEELDSPSDFSSSSGLGRNGVVNCMGVNGGAVTFCSGSMVAASTFSGVRDTSSSSWLSSCVSF
jgi:hypothetical protein